MAARATYEKLTGDLYRVLVNGKVITAGMPLAEARVICKAINSKKG